MLLVNATPKYQPPPPHKAYKYAANPIQSATQNSECIIKCSSIGGVWETNVHHSYHTHTQIPIRQVLHKWADAVSYISQPKHTHTLIYSYTARDHNGGATR